MSIGGAYAPQRNNGDGNSKVFGFTWPFFAYGDVKVQLWDTVNEVVVTPAPALNGLGTYDYTIAATQNSQTLEYGNGAVTFNNAPLASYQIVISRTTAQTQPNIFPMNAALPGPTVEATADRLEAQVQENSDVQSRSIVAPVTDPATANNMTLPIAPVRATHALGFDAYGNLLLSSSTLGQLDAAAQYVGLGGLVSGTLGAIATVDALLGLFPAAANLANGTAFLCGGRDAVGDMAPTLFYFNSGDVASADNGGTIRVDPVGRRWYAIVASIDPALFGAKLAAADNTTAYNNAVAAANAAGLMIKWTVLGQYEFTTITPTAAITGPGMEAPYPGAIVLSFNTPTDCLIFYGIEKKISNITVNNSNVTAGPASLVANIRIENCENGQFVGLNANHGAANRVGILLEHSYNAFPWSNLAFDAAFICHDGCWYNTFTNCNANYISVGAAGYGFGMQTAASAIGVVNPPGQAAGTYTGSCKANVIDNLDSESHDANVFMNEFCSGNEFRGGQLLGGNRGVKMTNSCQQNKFENVIINQPAIEPINEDASCGFNRYYINLQRPSVAFPWSFGTLQTNSEPDYSNTNSAGAKATSWKRDNKTAIAANGTFTIPLPLVWTVCRVIISTNQGAHAPWIGYAAFDGAATVGLTVLANSGGNIGVADNGAGGLTVTNLTGAIANMRYAVFIDESSVV